MSKQDFNAIILGGGTSSRMRLDSDIPKQLLPIHNNKTLLQYQIEWLQRHGIKDIILAIDTGTHEYIVDNIPYLLNMVTVSIETEKLGTGGATKAAMQHVTSDKVYVQNVDDFILSDFYTPDELIASLGTGFEASILTSRGVFPYGVIKSRGRRVTQFDQKPLLDSKVCSGHYAFRVRIINSRFHPLGDFESSVLPPLAKEKVLTFMDLDGTWITTNTWKELKEARKMICAFERRRQYGVDTNSRRDRGFTGYGRVRYP